MTSDLLKNYIYWLQSRGQIWPQFSERLDQEGFVLEEAVKPQDVNQSLSGRALLFLNDEPMTNQSQEMSAKIVKALKLNRQEFTWQFAASSKEEVDELVRNLAIRSVIVFGFQLAQRLKITIDGIHNQTSQWIPSSSASRPNYLVIPSFSEMLHNPTRKIEVWKFFQKYLIKL
jgi:hypothetical protein